jgi:hypothetical protein
VSDQETQEIEKGIAEATIPDGPWEFGHYIERNDNDSGWIPLIYGGLTEGLAQELHARHRYDGTRGDDVFRNSRVVRRAVSPWELWPR